MISLWVWGSVRIGSPVWPNLPGAQAPPPATVGPRTILVDFLPVGGVILLFTSAGIEVSTLNYDQHRDSLLAFVFVWSP